MGELARSEHLPAGGGNLGASCGFCSNTAGFALPESQCSFGRRVREQTGMTERDDAGFGQNTAPGFKRPRHSQEIDRPCRPYQIIGTGQVLHARFNDPHGRISCEPNFRCLDEVRNGLKPVHTAFGNKLTQSRKVAARSASRVAHMPSPGHRAQTPGPSDIVGEPRAFPGQVAMHREEGVPIHTVTYRNRSLPGQRAPLTAMVSANPTQSETEHTPALEVQKECPSSAKTGQIIRSDLVVVTTAIHPQRTVRASAWGWRLEVRLWREAASPPLLAAHR